MKFNKSKTIVWSTRDVKPPENTRIAVFSPEYAVGDAMRLRIIDSNFFKLTTEALYWAIVPEPSPGTKNI